MKTFQVRGQPIYIPENNDINWGNDVTDAFDTVAGAINTSATTEQVENVESFIGQYDVKPQKILAIEDGTWHTVPNMIFDKTKVLSVNASVTVLRKGGSTNERCVLDMEMIYDEDENDWGVSMMGLGDTEVRFDITPNGELQYQADSIGSTLFEIRYRAEAAAL